jgi:hypothetical protein
MLEMSGSVICRKRSYPLLKYMNSESNIPLSTSVKLIWHFLLINNYKVSLSD